MFALVIPKLIMII